MTNDLIRVILQEPLPSSPLSIGDWWPGVVAALVGAGVGALTAWFLQKQLLRAERQRQDRRDRQKQLDQRYEAGNRALFALFAQTNAMLDLRQNLAPYQGDEERWMTMPVFAHEYDSVPTVDFNSLTFILDEEFCPNALRDLYLAQSSFDTTRAALKTRNRLRTEIMHTEPETRERMVLEKQLRMLTDQISPSADRTYAKLRSVQSCLEQCLKKLGSGVEPISFVMIEGAQNKAIDSDKK